MSVKLSNIAISNIKGSDYRCIISHKVDAKCRFDRKKCNVKHENLLSLIKMGKEILTFGNIEIEKNKCYRDKTPIFLDVDIEKVLVPNKISFDEKNYKYFIGYLYHDNKVKPLHIIVPFL